MKREGKLLLVARLSAARGGGCCQSGAFRACDTRHGHQQVLHLGGEIATLGFFLHEAEDPIAKGTEKAADDELIQVSVLGQRLLVRADEGSAQAHERIEPEPGSDLQLAVTPTD